jgi:hypothetical protein
MYRLLSESESLFKIRDGGGVEVQTHVVRDKIKRSRGPESPDLKMCHMTLSYLNRAITLQPPKEEAPHF